METARTNIDGAIVIDGHPYGVGRAQGSTVCVQFGVNEWKPKKQNKNESDEAMQARVQADVDKWRAINKGPQMLQHWPGRQHRSASRPCLLSHLRPGLRGGC